MHTQFHASRYIWAALSPTSPWCSLETSAAHADAKWREHYRLWCFHVNYYYPASWRRPPGRARSHLVTIDIRALSAARIIILCMRNQSAGTGSCTYTSGVAKKNGARTARRRYGPSSIKKNLHILHLSIFQMYWKKQLHRGGSKGEPIGPGPP